MKRSSVHVIATLFVVFLCSNGFSQTIHAGHRIEIDELLWLQLSDEPEHHMYEAHRYFSGGEREAAGHNLRKAAVYLQIDAANVNGEGQNDLKLAADQLVMMARGIEDGTVTDPMDLKDAFARAEHAIAENHCACAKESWRHKQVREAGYRMRAAGAALERSAKWSGHELEAGLKASVKETRQMGAELVEGKDYVVDEIGRGLTSLGNGIATLGHRFER